MRTYLTVVLAVLSIGAAHADAVHLEDVEAVTIFYLGPGNAPAALGGITISPGQTVTGIPMKSIQSPQGPDLLCQETYNGSMGSIAGSIAVSCKASVAPIKCDATVEFNQDGTGQVISPPCGPDGQQLTVSVQHVRVPSTQQK